MDEPYTLDIIYTYDSIHLKPAASVRVFFSGFFFFYFSFSLAVFLFAAMRVLVDKIK